MNDAMVPSDAMLASIHPVRGQKVLPDHDLAMLYGVETKALVQAVSRIARDIESTKQLPYAGPTVDMCHVTVYV